MLTLVDNFGGTFLIFTLGIFELIGIFWVYGKYSPNNIMCFLSSALKQLHAQIYSRFGRILFRYGIHDRKKSFILLAILLAISNAANNDIRLCLLNGNTCTTYLRRTKLSGRIHDGRLEYIFHWFTPTSVVGFICILPLL